MRLGRRNASRLPSLTLYTGFALPLLEEIIQLKINVHLKGRFKEAFKLPDPYALEIENATNVRGLLDRLCQDTGNPPDTFFNKDLRLKPNVAVTKNGRFIIHLNWLDTPIEAGDTITIFTLHCGG
jgi:sulfur carrier protein ThiS